MGNSTKGSFDKLYNSLKKSVEKTVEKAILDGTEQANNDTAVKIDPSKIVVESIDISKLIKLDDSGLKKKIDSLFKKTGEMVSESADKEFISAMQVALQRGVGDPKELKRNLEMYDGIYSKFINESQNKIQQYYKQQVTPNPIGDVNKIKQNAKEVITETTKANKELNKISSQSIKSGKIKIFDGIKEEIYDTVKDYDLILAKMEEVAQRMKFPVFHTGNISRNTLKNKNYESADNFGEIWNARPGDARSPGNGIYVSSNANAVKERHIQGDDKKHTGKQSLYALDLNDYNNEMYSFVSDYTYEMFQSTVQDVTNNILKGLGKDMGVEYIPSIDEIYDNYQELFNAIDVSFEDFKSWLKQATEYAKMASKDKSAMFKKNSISRLFVEDLMGGKGGINATKTFRSDSDAAGSVIFDINKSQPYSIDFGDNTELYDKFYEMVETKILREKSKNAAGIDYFLKKGGNESVTPLERVSDLLNEYQTKQELDKNFISLLEKDYQNYSAMNENLYEREQLINQSLLQNRNNKSQSKQNAIDADSLGDNKYSRVLNNNYTTSNKREATNQLRDAYNEYQKYLGEDGIDRDKIARQMSDEGRIAAYSYAQALKEALRQEIAESNLEKYMIPNFDEYTKSSDIDAEFSDITSFMKEQARILSELGNPELTKQTKDALDTYMHQWDLVQARSEDDFDYYKDKDGLIDQSYVKADLEILDLFKEDLISIVNTKNELNDWTSNQTPIPSEDTTGNINAKTEALEREEEQVRKTAEAIEEKNKTEQEFITSPSSNLSEIEKQTEANLELAEAMDKVDKEKIDNATNDITEESTKATSKEAQAMADLFDKAIQAAEAKEKFAGANKEVLESIISSLQGLDSEGNGFANLNKIINKLSNDKKSEALINTLTQIRDLLSKPINDDSFINAIREISKEGTNLKDVATVLRATKEQIAKAKELTNANKKSAADEEAEKIKRATELYKEIATDEKWLGKNKEGTNVIEYEARTEAIKRAREELSALELTDEQEAQAAKNASKQTIAAANAIAEAKRKQEEQTQKNIKAAEQEQIQAIKQATSMMQNGKLMAEYGDKVREILGRIKGINTSIDPTEAISQLKDLRSELTTISATAEEAGKSGQTFGQMLTQRFKSLGAYLATFVQFYDIVRYTRQAIETIKELDAQMVELAKVSEQSLGQIKNDFTSYTDVAKNLGATITDTISATADWARLGYNVPDAKQLAEVALLYKNVGDGIDIDTANQSLISTLQGYQMQADQAEHIVDVFNEVYS